MLVMTESKMDELLRLTRAGRVAEATALIQSGLGLPASATPPPTDTALAPPFIDMVAPTAAGGAWTSDIANGRTESPAGEAAPARPGSFEYRIVANQAGTRRYKLYVPKIYAGRPLSLVIMLHGCTQSPEDFAAGTRMNDVADELGLLVAYPEQTQAANASKCWNWFKPGDQRRDRGEPSIMADIVRQIMRDVAVDAGKVFVAGLSAGGAAAAVLAEAYPDLFAGACVHSGLACGAAHDMPSAFAAMRSGSPAHEAPASSRDALPVPTIVFHGTADHTVSPANARHVAAPATNGLSAPRTTQGRSAGGVGYTRTSYRNRDGSPAAEVWMLDGAGHAWAGGSSAGSFTDPRGPDASREMMRFFLSL